MTVDEKGAMVGLSTKELEPEEVKKLSGPRTAVYPIGSDTTIEYGKRWAEAFSSARKQLARPNGKGAESMLSVANPDKGPII